MQSAKERKEAKLKKRNEKIRNRYAHFIDKKHFNNEHALDLLEEEYLPLERETIWLIIRKTGHYKNL